MLLSPENAKLMLLATGGCWLLLILFVLARPQRLFNSFFLLFDIGATLFSLMVLFWDHMGVVLPLLLAAAVAAVLMVPVLLICDGVMMLKKESKSLANSLSLLLGLALAAAEVALAFLILWGAGDSLGRTVSGLMLLGSLSVLYFSALILTFVVYVLFMQYMPHLRRYDYIIIHGCGLIDGERVSKLLSNRVDRAIKVFRRGKGRAYLIPSGGQGPDEKISEAEAMRAYLLEKGIPEDKIILEDKSMSTEENLLYSKRIIDSREGKKRIALVTSSYHVYRCLLLAESLGIRCAGIGAGVAGYYWPSAVIREFIAVFSRKRYLLITALGYYVFAVMPLIIFLMSTG